MGNNKSSKKVELSNTPKNTKAKRTADKPVNKANKPLSAAVVPVVPVVIPAVVVEPAVPAIVPVIEAAVPAIVPVEPVVEAPVPAIVPVVPVVEAAVRAIVPVEPVVEDATPAIAPVEPVVEPAVQVIATPVSVEESSVTVISVGEGDTCNAAAKVAAGKMPVDFYYLPPSPPCRCVMLLAKIIGLDLNLKLTDILKGAHMTPEFLKLNPQHTIPVLEDNGLVLSESRAILGYLVNQYAKNDNLYPREARTRAVVDQRMYFDVGTLYQRCLNYYMAYIFHGTGNTPENMEKLQEAMGWFNTMLDGHNYAAGSHLTIADISLVVTVSNLDVFGFDLASYPNVAAWYARTKQDLAPYGYEEINQAGANIMGGFYKAKLESS